jgi:hypothetical protein
VGAAVVGGGDGAEPFLAGRVPLSQVSRCRFFSHMRSRPGRGVRSEASPSCRRARWSGFSARVSSRALTARPFSRVTYKVDADRGDVGLGVGIVGEPQQEARLADTGVTDEQQLEEVVVSVMLLAAWTWRLQA